MNETDVTAVLYETYRKTSKGNFRIFWVETTDYKFFMNGEAEVFLETMKEDFILYCLHLTPVYETSEVYNLFSLVWVTFWLCESLHNVSGSFIVICLLSWVGETGYINSFNHYAIQSRVHCQCTSWNTNSSHVSY